jgi:GAF domain-containing protein/anti-anti-sigma regulatory factor
MAKKRTPQQDVALEVVCNIGRAVAAEMDLPNLLELIYRETGRVMDADCFAMALYDPLEDGLRFELLYDRGERIPSLLRHRQEGWGLAGRVFEERAPLLFADLQSEGLPEEAIPLGDVPRSWLGVPLVAHDRAIGVVSVQNYEPEAFSEADRHLLEAISSQAAVAIENLFLRREHERRIAELSALSEIGQAIITTTRIEDLLEVIYRQASRVMDTSNLYVALYHPDRELVTFDYFVEDGQRVKKDDLHLADGGLTVRVVQTRQPLLLGENIEKELGTMEIQAVGRPAASYLGVPMLAGDRVVGVVAVQSPDRPRAYDHRNLDLLTNIANLAAVAIENTRLSTERESRLADLAVLNEVSQAILRAESEEELLEALHQQVSRVMETANFYVALYDEAKQMLDFAYSVEDGVRGGRRQQPVAGAGLTAHIVRNREPLFLVVGMDEQLRSRGIVGRGRAARSYIGVPMMVGDQVVGAMAVQSYEHEQAFTPRHLALFTNIATQAALVLQRMRLRNSESRKAHQLAIIGEVGRKVTVVLDLDELLRELARSIQLGFGYSNVAVFRVDDEAKELVLGALVGRYAGIMDWGFRQPLNEGLSGWAAQNGKTVVCGNVTEDSRYVRGFDTEEITLSEMCVPVIYAQRVSGVLDIQSEVENAFDQEDVAAMETLAGQLAAAMRNAILFRERGEQLANLNALNRVIQATAAAFTLDDLLTALCDVVVEMMSPDGFFVALYGKDGETLIAPFVMDEGVFYRDYQISKKGFTEYMLRTGKPVFIRNMTQEGDKYPVEPAAMGSTKPAASWLGVPLQSAERTIGALVVQSYRNYAFDEGDLSFLQTIANQIVVSIEKARLFGETQSTLEELREANEQQRRLFSIVRELSTPLVPIAEGILVLPLVGTVDSQRAQQIMDVLLGGIAERRAKVVILDITGVPVVDTSVANYLLQATQAVRLLGAECILVGITPEVAQTVVGLGVDLQGLVTRSDLQGGVEYGLKLLGQRIVKPPKRVLLPGEKHAAPEERTLPPAPPAPLR